ncbi:MAG TPA: limonene-1,2-epoxide hydrolase family protein, partial [Solirubrobacteraceae bacterium]|nr:limonene-1,2-epoxide hydrolase family protein [Solirubrobacteraceae bacterium]
MVEPASKPNGIVADRPGIDSSPVPVVERFLEFLRRGDLDEAVALLAVDVIYENVGLPTVHG